MRIAVFPGSFDPFTLAHKDLVDRSLSLFDKIYIAIGVNSSKKGLMAFEKRKSAIESVYVNSDQVIVGLFSGLTVDYCSSVGARFILRGLRNANDLIYEDAIAQNNLILAPHIETYFLLSRSGTAHISSTIVRDILANGGAIDRLVPQEVIDFIED
ncbi:pantetheine-phosphate adenylyltransferase [Sphingobacterium alkalisoli]|uniref:Phosphopantetheine adenylyltransferase n=1 Tax=Sphingobacterium alkalisoli TaxID=1874115 RepID=A0A4U0H319_9SPHI|nr:pantetheine-phosphate adenylyltransferase [Sphingobacterium alkalisoli]TJY65908.1 pantetheine-phosphate adenylyltransferase [Sphingobacterium alkalisoli]GGH17553.1 phosphopantetheine adenylyltransferase [Sphingobacterium alkalisoli]